ncbi:MAG: hypothetical protein KDB47_06990 [Mycobacterium sp.]|nr:hypothetical protein [Mycobacterium sp.]
MAYQKMYRTVVPIARDGEVDDAAVVWFARESFDRAAAADCLVIAEFTDCGEVAAEEIPPKAEKQLGRRATDFVWRCFEGVGRRADAESV